MYTTVNEPVVATRGARLDKRAAGERNARDLYGCMDPATWGWRRPTAEEVLAERIAVLEQMFAQST